MRETRKIACGHLATTVAKPAPDAAASSSSQAAARAIAADLRATAVAALAADATGASCVFLCSAANVGPRDVANLIA